MRQRITDANGALCEHIKGMHEAVEACVAVFEDLETKGVDRGDMFKVLSTMYQEIHFTLLFHVCGENVSHWRDLAEINNQP